MLTIVVENGVKIADLTRNAYPFRELVAVGQSFFIEEFNVPSRKTLDSSAAYYARKIRGAKFSVRKVEGGFRVWRIA